MMRDVQVARGIPLWLMQDYLEELGGYVEEDGRVTGPGWTATLTQLEPFRLGSLRVGQVQLVLEGDTETLAELKPQLEKKTMRAGA
ncbi:MAG: DUF1952 domain-containing protein [Ardenticatenaceae bacterium]|nr:DUF1952 domain-containing protein [Anaerolineales bacterium]MCB8920387.1 DUF1952 domain-containing protein [Ardenticatenaceae bacterium]MCB8989342.1 DUF1952 domain-containing protein [Ardenticatenaceae bacterium]